MERSLTVKIIYDDKNASAEDIENAIADLPSVEDVEIKKKVFRIKAMTPSGVCHTEDLQEFNCIEDAEEEYPPSEDYFVLEVR